jgi:hypothetical protein
MTDYNRLTAEPHAFDPRTSGVTDASDRTCAALRAMAKEMRERADEIEREANYMTEHLPRREWSAEANISYVNTQIAGAWVKVTNLRRFVAGRESAPQ